MKLSFSKGATMGVIVGSLLTIPATYGATKLIQANIVSASISANGKVVSSQPALKYNGNVYLSVGSVESGLSSAGVKYHWNGSTLSIGNASASNSSGSASASTSSQTGVTFENMVCKDDGTGSAEVDGIAVNHDKSNHQTIMLIVSFFDKSGKLLGTGDGAISSLAGGASIAFQTISSIPYSSVASFKVQVQAMM